VFEARGSILKGIKENVSFTVIIFFLFKHLPYFFYHTSYTYFFGSFTCVQRVMEVLMDVLMDIMNINRPLKYTTVHFKFLPTSVQ